MSIIGGRVRGLIFSGCRNAVSVCRQTENKAVDARHLRSLQTKELQPLSARAGAFRDMGEASMDRYSEIKSTDGIKSLDLKISLILAGYLEIQEGLRG